jgi:hypothetical protein
MMSQDWWLWYSVVRSEMKAPSPVRDAGSLFAVSGNTIGPLQALTP